MVVSCPFLVANDWRAGSSPGFLAQERQRFLECKEKLSSSQMEKVKRKRGVLIVEALILGERGS